MRAAAMSSLRFLLPGLTRVGLVRRHDEDAFLDRPEEGRGVALWAVDPVARG